MDAQAYLGKCLGKVLEEKGQDLFLKVGSVPRTRVGAKVIEMEFELVTEEMTRELVKQILSDAQKKKLEENKSVDFAFSLAGTTKRFRTNVFLQQGCYSFVIRTLWQSIPSLDDLGIPPVVEKIGLERQGLILIAGVVASGKTTTIHAMVETMNQKSNRHILTIEDPVEYLHQDKQCIINQREVGQDTNDFQSAMKYVVRQSPDVIVLGEMRDAETLNFALNSAEVGRLVIGTVHAKTVVQIFDRLLGFYPPDQRGPILSQIYPNVTCFMVQKLVFGKDGKSLLPAFEIMVGNYTTRQLVKERQFDKIPQALRNAEKEGMTTMDQYLLKLWREERITAEEAKKNSERPEELEINMKGIQISGQKGKILGGS